MDNNGSEVLVETPAPRKKKAFTTKFVCKCGLDVIIETDNPDFSKAVEATKKCTKCRKV